METWCFLGILFSLPHNKADVYLHAASTPKLIALDLCEISYEICIANVNGGSLVEVGMPNQIRSHPSRGTRIGQIIIILYSYE